MSLKVTFYGYPDNDGSGTFGTNLIAYALQWQGHNRHRNAQGEPIAGGGGTMTTRSRWPPLRATAACRPGR